MLRGLRYRVLLAVAAVATVALIAGAVLVVLDPNAQTLSEGMWWSLLRLTDPGYLGTEEGALRRTVALILTLLGYVLFLGLFIAILTNWLDDAISELHSGRTPVPFADHVVILGWTFCTPTIVTELLRSRDQVRRFLAGRDARELRIVILAPQLDDDLVRMVHARIAGLRKNGRVYVRAGSQLKIDHLERTSLRDAAVMILPTSYGSNGGPEAIDAQTVKTLRSVSRIACDTDTTLPLAVAEIFDGRRRTVAGRAYAGPTEIIATDQLISRFITQSVRHNGLFDVFAEFLAPAAGSVLQVLPASAHAGVAFGRLRSPRAVLLGIVRSGDQQSVLNPHPDTVLEADDHLVFIAWHSDECEVRVEHQKVAVTENALFTEDVPEQHRVLILGWNRKVPAILDEFRSYGNDFFQIDVASAVPSRERDILIEGYDCSLSEWSVRQIEADLTVPGVLEQLEPHAFDNIVLLASDRFADQDQADANTVFTYLALTDLIPDENPRPELIIELLDAENLPLFPSDKEDIIVSPRLVSHMLAQVSLCRELAPVIRELAQPTGAQIQLLPALQYLGTEDSMSFDGIEQAAFERGQIALGIRRVQGTASRVELNPDRAVAWKFGPDDEVVVLATVNKQHQALRTTNSQ